jgi:DNA-binding transcriptional MerR regulator
MLIGELARASGTSTRALRYYEQQGLLVARRRDNGYRDYDEADLRVVREIRSLLASGFDLDEIRPFVACIRDGIELRGACPGASEQYRRKLAELDAHLARVVALRDRVAAELARLTGTATPGARRRHRPTGETGETERTEEVEASTDCAAGTPRP